MSNLRRAEHIILETNMQPFGYSAYNPKERVSDFVGRSEETAEFKQYIQLVYQKGVSQAIRLEGPAGVGKSTLFNYIKEEIEKERLDQSKPLQFLDTNVDVISAYFRMPEGVSGFRSIWQRFPDALNFEQETKATDIGFPEYVALRIIHRLLLDNPEEMSAIIWKNEPTPDIRCIQFHELVDRILDVSQSLIPDIQKYFNKNKRKIRKSLKTKINGKSYGITRNDTFQILNLFRTLNEDDLDQYYLLVNRADRSIFPTDDSVISYFNDLRRYYVCSTKKQLILLLGVDEIVKYDHTIGEAFYENLGRMFVKWRDLLQSILFVFISTTDDWHIYDQKIMKISDLQQQIQVILQKMTLNQLRIDDCIMVFRNRMKAMWDNYSSERPSRYPYYPFTNELFEYVLRYNHRNLRDSIIYLNRIWTEFNRKNQVTLCDTKLKSLQFVRVHKYKSIFCRDFKKFDWDIINDHFLKSPYNSSNTSRSSALEKGLEAAWKCIQQQESSMITRVENNPKIKIKGHERRPDVVVEILGQFDEEEKRRIEFQVKAYKPGNTISWSHIQSSLELFYTGYTDLLYFVMSGELDNRGKNELNELASKFPSRIRRPQLRDEQINHQYFLAIYEDIVGWQLGSNRDIDMDNAGYALEKIIDQPINDLFDTVRRMPYRPLDNNVVIPYIKDTQDLSKYFDGDQVHSNGIMTDSQSEMEDTAIELEPEVGLYTAKPSTSLINQTLITKDELVQVDKSNIEAETELFEWVSDYGYLSNYIHETLALVGYLVTRENNRRFKNKYTLSTIKKNVIDKDATLEDYRFKEFNKILLNKKLIVKVKTSFILTATGILFYKGVKKEINFQK